MNSSNTHTGMMMMMAQSIGDGKEINRAFMKCWDWARWRDECMRLHGDMGNGDSLA